MSPNLGSRASRLPSSLPLSTGLVLFPLSATQWGRGPGRARVSPPPPHPSTPAQSSLSSATTPHPPPPDSTPAATPSVPSVSSPQPGPHWCAHNTFPHYSCSPSTQIASNTLLQPLHK